MSRNKLFLCLSIIIALTVLLWGFFIWPTLYRYEKVKRPWYKSSKEEVYRINRFTGTATKVIDPLSPDFTN